MKRLFFNTRQWLEQFFNEVQLVSQVQHKNLVKLFGCSVEGPESLLVYEYLCNTSLDHFLFGMCKRKFYIYSLMFARLSVRKIKRKILCSFKMNVTKLSRCIQEEFIGLGKEV